MNLKKVKKILRNKSNQVSFECVETDGWASYKDHGRFDSVAELRAFVDSWNGDYEDQFGKNQVFDGPNLGCYIVIEAIGSDLLLRERFSYEELDSLEQHMEKIK